MQPLGMLFLAPCPDSGHSRSPHSLTIKEGREPHSVGKAEAWPSPQGDQLCRQGLAVTGQSRQEPPSLLVLQCRHAKKRAVSAPGRGGQQAGWALGDTTYPQAHGLCERQDKPCSQASGTNGLT